MTRCPNSPPKHRHSTTGKGKPSNYKYGMKGHSWKIIRDDEGNKIGRICRWCKQTPKG